MTHFKYTFIFPEVKYPFNIHLSQGSRMDPHILRVLSRSRRSWGNFYSGEWETTSDI